MIGGPHGESPQQREADATTFDRRWAIVLTFPASSANYQL